MKALNQEQTEAVIERAVKLILRGDDNWPSASGIGGMELIAGLQAAVVALSRAIRESVKKGDE